MSSIKIKYYLFLFIGSIILFTYGCGTCSTEIIFSNNSQSNQSIEITNENGNVTNFVLVPTSDSTYYSEHFSGTTIKFSSLLPRYIYKAEDVDHWFSQNHKFQISIQNDSIRFKDFGEFYWSVVQQNKNYSTE